MRFRSSFKHIFVFLLLLANIVAANARGDASAIDLLARGKHAWQRVDSGWNFVNGEISGATSIMHGAITDPAASTFLVSNMVFGGDIAVSMDVTFDKGRYLGVYLDFDQTSQTGIWMATGHPLPNEAEPNEVERAYIKTVEESSWIVRATGALVIDLNTKLRLRFVRIGDYYSIYKEDTLIVSYRKSGGYPAGPLQLRLTNAAARIHKLLVESEWQRSERPRTR